MTTTLSNTGLSRLEMTGNGILIESNGTTIEITAALWQVIHAKMERAGVNAYDTIRLV